MPDPRFSGEGEIKDDVMTTSPLGYSITKSIIRNEKDRTNNSFIVGGVYVW